MAQKMRFLTCGVTVSCISSGALPLPQCAICHVGLAPPSTRLKSEFPLMQSFASPASSNLSSPESGMKVTCSWSQYTPGIDKTTQQMTRACNRRLPLVHCLARRVPSLSWQANDRRPSPSGGTATQKQFRFRCSRAPSSRAFGRSLTATRWSVSNESLNDSDMPKETPPLFECFPYVCPEPVLVK